MKQSFFNGNLNYQDVCPWMKCVGLWAQAPACPCVWGRLSSPWLLFYSCLLVFSFIATALSGINLFQSSTPMFYILQLLSSFVVLWILDSYHSSRTLKICGYYILFSYQEYSGLDFLLASWNCLLLELGSKC